MELNLSILITLGIDPRPKAWQYDSRRDGETTVTGAPGNSADNSYELSLKSRKSFHLDTDVTRIFGPRWGISGTTVFLLTPLAKLRDDIVINWIVNLIKSHTSFRTPALLL